MTEQHPPRAPRGATLVLSNGEPLPLVPHYDGPDAHGMAVWGLYLTGSDSQHVELAPGAFQLHFDEFPGRTSVYLAMESLGDKVFRVLCDDERDS